MENAVTKFDFLPLRLIRIAKNLKQSEMAKIFGVTRQYINYIEQGRRVMGEELLVNGLAKMDIPCNSYRELERFTNYIIRENLLNQEMYARALSKAIGIVCHDIKEKTDAIALLPCEKKKTEVVKEKSNNYIKGFTVYNVEANMFHPLKLIRYAMGISSDDVALAFNVSKSYIYAVEKEERTMTEEKLNFGLNNLGITYEDYLKLYRYINKITRDQKLDSALYSQALAKTIGVVDPKLKIEADKVAATIAKKRK